MWSLKAGVRTRRLRKPLGGRRMDAHDRLPGKGKGGPEIPKDLLKGSQRQDRAAPGDSVGNCSGVGTGGQAAYRGVGRTRRTEKGYSPSTIRIHLGPQDKGEAAPPQPRRLEPTECRCLGGSPSTLPGMSVPEATVHFGDRPSQAWGGQKLNSPRKGEPEWPGLISPFRSPESCSHMITSDRTDWLHLS